MRVGLIGVGTMGGRMGPRLLAGGHELTVNDVRPEAATELREAGATWAEDPAGVAKASEVVLTSLPNPAVIEQVAEELMEAMTPGSVYVDISTSPPALARKLTEAFGKRDIAVLDAPLSSGGVFTTVGGDEDVFERCRPVFEAMCEHVLYVGRTGMGQVTKLVRQHVSFGSFILEAEALLICAKAGGDVKAVAEFLSASVGRSQFHARAMDRVFKRDFGTPENSSAKLDIVAKDLSLAVDAAREVDAPVHMGTYVADVLRRGQDQGWGRNEFWSAVQVLEQEAGCELSADVE
ncbi:MAG: NAD(P)-dependent oxidoreductase [Dehalococcoidia bacterium]